MRALRTPWLPILLALGTSTPASAVQDYGLTLLGSGTRIIDGHGCLPTHPTWPVCNESISWIGQVHLRTSTGLDGSFTGNELLAFDLVSNFGGFATDGNNAGDVMHLGSPTASVTILGGEVRSLQLSWRNFCGPTYQFSGMQAQLGSMLCGHGDLLDAKASITPLVSAIPEPGSWALLALGLGAMAVRLRRRLQ